eukprot:gene9814-7706_t
MSPGKRLRAKKYADIIGKVARVPLQEFNVPKRASSVKYFSGRVIKKDTSHKDCVVVRFSDGSKFYWPAEQVRSWVHGDATDLTVDGNGKQKKAFSQPNSAQGPADSNTELAAYASETLPNHVVEAMDVDSDSGAEEEASESVEDGLGQLLGENAAQGDKCCSAGGSHTAGGAEEGPGPLQLVEGAAELLPSASQQPRADFDLEGDQLTSVLPSSPTEGGVVAQRSRMETSGLGADASGSEASASELLMSTPSASEPQPSLAPPSSLDVQQELLGHMKRALRRQFAQQHWPPQMPEHCPRTSGWHLGRSLLAKQSEPRLPEVNVDQLVCVSLLHQRRCLPEQILINTLTAPSEGTSPATKNAGGAAQASGKEQVQVEQVPQQQVEEQQQGLEVNASTCKRGSDGHLKGAKDESPVTAPAYAMPHRRPKFVNRRAANTHGQNASASAKGPVMKSDPGSGAAASHPYAPNSLPPKAVAPAHIAACDPSPRDAALISKQAMRTDNSKSSSLLVAEAVVSSLNHMSRLPTGADHSSQLDRSHNFTSSSTGRGNTTLPEVALGTDTAATEANYGPTVQVSFPRDGGWGLQSGTYDVRSDNTYSLRSSYYGPLSVFNGEWRDEEARDLTGSMVADRGLLPAQRAIEDALLLIHYRISFLELLSILNCDSYSCSRQRQIRLEQAENVYTH